MIMHVKVWVGGCLAAAVAAAGAAWFTIAAQEPATATHAVCGPDLGRDDVVAARSQAVAVVEAVENTRYREDGGSAYLTTRVKTLEALKGEFGAVLDVTQGVKNGGAPGRYATEDPDRYAVLEPGRRYVIAVQSGSTSGTAGTGAWAWYAEPAERGLAGEREHWQKAIATPPETAAGSECEDIDTPAG
ncbi:hypothetical protein [Streptomyces sp. fd1-xmd]|uniref:hypothetical protein n=1 Tax=Streptomyces sp. fd1-xmd TaxID=1812480 RepID=UPI00099079C2|nr:hypothetical protein [Streptomyces sp. fd1-xmd]AQT70363.1 hypothetical protein B1K54_00045 [Streptomyces sp. fd1-xmd]